MNFALLQKPLFHVAGHYVSFLGLLAFAILFAIGLITAKTLQSDAVRRFFARFKLDTNFIAIVTTILSVSALAFFTVTARQRRRRSTPLDCASSGGHAQSRSDIPADRAAHRGLLVFLADEAIPF